MRGEGILQAQKNVEKDKKIKSTGIDETGVTTTPLEALTKQAEKEKIEGKSLDKIEKENKESNVNIDSFAKDKKGSVNVSQPIVDKKAKIIEPGAKINETNAKLTQTDKELKEAIPAGKNLGAKKVTSKIDEKIEEAANSYEKHKEKLGKTDDRYAADEAKRTDYMKKIENIMEEEEDEIDLFC